MRTIAVDFETYYHKKEFSVSSLGNWKYNHSEQTDAYMVSVFDGEDGWVGHPRDLNWAALEGAPLIAHNAAFDSQVHAALVEKKLIDPVQHAGWQCTANMTAYLFNQRSLNNATRLIYNRSLDKAMRSEMSGKHWEDVVKEGPEAVNRLKEYALDDTKWCWRLWNDFNHLWPEWEQNLSRLTMKQCSRGVKIDKEKLFRYISVLEVVLYQTEQALPWVAQGAKPTSPKALAIACREVNIPQAPVKSRDGEEAFEEWAELYGPTYPWIRAVSHHRKISKLLASFNTIRTRLRPDDTIDFSLLYMGAHCFTGDHEVLTPEGWVRLDQWNGGNIMQWKDGALLYGEAVSNKLDASQSGEKLLEVKTSQINLVCTEGHWLATLNKKGDFVKRQAGEVRDVRTHIPLSALYKEGEKDLPPWRVQLLAAVQADGHYLSNRRGAIRFRFSKPRKVERLRSILRQSNLRWEETTYPSEPTVTVFVVKQIPDWLENRKEWGSEILSWTPACRELLLQELIHWDGDRSGINSFTYTTTSRNNADWIALLAHLCGRASNVSIRKHPEKNWKDSYRVSIRNSSKTRVQPKDWKEVGRAGKVFCPTSEYGVCLFRYKDNIFLSYQTGRWAGAGSGLNMQNLRKDPLYISDDYGFFDREIENPREIIDVRSLFVPRDGHQFIISDLSQIEPRCLNWIIGNTEMLDMVRNGMSIYEAHARATMGWKGGNLKVEDKVRYALAKARILALGYGCGDGKFVTMAFDLAGLRLTPEESKATVTDFRNSNPKIVGLWNTLDRTLRRSVGSEMEIELPSGRKLTYKKIRREQTMVKDKDGKILPKTNFKADIGGRRVMTYGGKLTENLIQAVGRDVFGYHLLELEKAGAPSLFHVHDEAITETPEGVDPREVEEIMSRVPDWLEGCPIAAEAHVAPHYHK